MTLLTPEQNEQLLKNGSPENRGKNHVPVVKLVMPNTKYSWLLTEIDPEKPYLAFGLCDLGIGSPDFGYVDLDELLFVKTGLGLQVETDVSFVGRYPISIYAGAAIVYGRITEIGIILRLYITIRKWFETKTA